LNSKPLGEVSFPSSSIIARVNKKGGSGLPEPAIIPLTPLPKARK